MKKSRKELLVIVAAVAIAAMGLIQLTAQSAYACDLQRCDDICTPFNSGTPCSLPPCIHTTCPPV